MSWTPIDADKYAEYENLCWKIHASFGMTEGGFSSLDDNSLMYGKAGFLLYYAYACKVFNNEQYRLLFSNTLQALLKDLQRDPEPSFNFGRGVTGIAWALDHVADMGLIEQKELLAPFRPFLKDFSCNRLQQKDYDYLLGGLGYPLSLLHKELSAADKDYLAQIVQQLEDIAIKKNGLTCWQQIKPDEPDKINLGAAHGLPAILVYLSKCYQLGIETKRSEALVTSGMEYLLQTRLHNKSSLFPYAISDNRDLGETPLRWCYGDMGIGLTLINTGINCNNPDWIKAGIETGRACVQRMHEADFVSDAHICHGTGGLAHIFNRYYHFSGEETFKNAAIDCIDLTLLKASYKKNYLSFIADKGEFGNIVIDGLMEGNAGVGLILMATISTVEPKWDSAFLMS